MKVSLVTSCTLLCALLALPVRADVRSELIEVENHWLQVEDDPDALESILASDFIHVVGAGMITKREQLDFMRKHPRREKSERHFEDLHIRAYGRVGIVNGIVVAGTKKTAF